MISQTDTCRKPGTVVVHLEDAAATGRAVVRTIGLAGLAFLAEPNLAIALDGEGSRLRIVLGGEETVAVIVRC